MTGAAGWLAALRPALPDLTGTDLARLAGFEEHLDGLLTRHPVGGAAAPAVRSTSLQVIRSRLASAGFLGLAVPARYGGCGRPATMQALLQFICGYHDVDLRDSTGLGHGRLVAEHATPQVRDRWLPQLHTGAVAGIAITESHGGSQVRKTTTTATGPADGAWTVTGTKTWISRLDEAALFCVFFTSPGQALTAAVISARTPGLHRAPITPAGLSGWAWGELHLDGVRVRRCEILGQPGEGMVLLREHFAHYRPLVAATALGAAAGMHDHISARLAARRHAGYIADLRDNALITLGRTYAQVNAALLATLNTQRLADGADPAACLWGCAIKAHAVDTAYQAASELALLAGAAGFTASSATAKACRDINALLYADGIHDSLYRSAGRALTRPPAPHPSVAIPLPAAAPEADNLVHA